jgi:hypothetical protein
MSVASDLWVTLKVALGRWLRTGCVAACERGAEKAAAAHERGAERVAAAWERGAEKLAGAHERGLVRLHGNSLQQSVGILGCMGGYAQPAIPCSRKLRLSCSRSSHTCVTLLFVYPQRDILGVPGPDQNGPSSIRHGRSEWCARHRSRPLPCPLTLPISFKLRPCTCSRSDYRVPIVSASNSCIIRFESDLTTLALSLRATNHQHSPSLHPALF